MGGPPQAREYVRCEAYISGVGSQRFRRALGGYDRPQVDAAVASLDSRIASLEAEGKALAAKLSDAEARLRDARALAEAADPTGTVAALMRAVEEIHAQARSQATRIRMKALQDAVAVAERVGELAGIRDELSKQVIEEEAAGGQSGFARRPAASAQPEVDALEDGWSGRVDIDAGPIADFAQMTAIEDALREIDAVSSVSVRGLSEGRANLTAHLDEPVDLLAALDGAVPFALNPTSATPEAISLQLEDDSQAARAA